MDINKWLLYIIIINLSLYCPGPMTLFLLNKGIVYRYRETLFCILGASSAYLGQMLFVIFGFTIINNTLPMAFEILKYIGAIYFVYLGIKQFLSGYIVIAEDKQKLNNVLQLFRQGFLIGISNPKAIFLFIALFSQLIDITGKYNIPLQQIIFIATFLFFQFISASVYAVLGSNIYKQMVKKGFVNLQKLLTGSIFIMLGVILATAKIT